MTQLQSPPCSCSLYVAVIQRECCCTCFSMKKSHNGQNIYTGSLHKDKGGLSKKQLGWSLDSGSIAESCTDVVLFWVFLGFNSSMTRCMENESRDFASWDSVSLLKMFFL